MKQTRRFMDEDFLLETKAAQDLYHGFAENAPIFDYHCHLPPRQVAENRNFINLTDIWLRGDHYKWRAQRSNGVAERLITGDASDEEKFMAWAATVPATIGNPLYHWTHLELRRHFGIEELLSPASAERIWKQCNEQIASPALRPRSIMERFRVKVICTTDDPVDDLAWHGAAAAEKGVKTRMLPAFRPDKAVAAENIEAYNQYLDSLAEAAGMSIKRYDELVEALDRRHEYFHAAGCRLTDHALIAPAAEFATAAELDAIMLKVRQRRRPENREIEQLRTAVLLEIGRMNARRGWTMQLHIGALRSNNSRMLRRLGPDTGFDSMADLPIAAPLARFLDALESEGRLPRTIVYVLNPRDNEVVATMIGNFQSETPGKMQFGSAWWFNDQKDGMERQMTALAHMGLLSRFVGMLTDSRSFMSYPRHEYFRRILCNLIGGWVEKGEAPADMGLLGAMVGDICFDNAARYFGIAVD